MQSPADALARSYQRAVEQVTSTRESIAESARLVADSRTLIAESRRLLAAMEHPPVLAMPIQPGAAAAEAVPGGQEAGASAFGLCFSEGEAFRLDGGESAQRSPGRWDVGDGVARPHRCFPCGNDLDRTCQKQICARHFHAALDFLRQIYTKSLHLAFRDRCHRLKA
jgi:hypothetical protein